MAIPEHHGKEKGEILALLKSMDVFYNGLFKVRILSACAFSHYQAEQGTR